MRGGGGRQKQQQQQQQQQQRLVSMAIPALAGHQKDWKTRKAGKEEERAVLGLESATIRKVSMGKTVGSSSSSSSKSNRAVGKKDERKEKGGGGRKDGKGVNGVDAEEREVRREMMKSFFLHSTSDGHDNAYLLSPPSAAAAAAAAAADGSQEFSYDEEIEPEEEKDEGDEVEGEEEEEKENKPRAKPPSSSSSFSKVHAPVTQLGKWATPGSWRQLRPKGSGQREAKGRGETRV